MSKRDRVGYYHYTRSRPASNSDQQSLYYYRRPSQAPLDPRRTKTSSSVQPLLLLLLLLSSSSSICNPTTSISTVFETLHGVHQLVPCILFLFRGFLDL
ncbi:unnamed protein product [Periconia digitata]|uniref:Uncharacterized protein n=1 Tax=Periconia digitata TaxID=1303443 RepID=A0A9W4UR49_9PLEO|nr:unnamed protein product [Periconia digitata]